MKDRYRLQLYLASVKAKTTMALGVPERLTKGCSCSCHDNVTARSVKAAQGPVNG